MHTRAPRNNCVAADAESTFYLAHTSCLGRLLLHQMRSDMFVGLSLCRKCVQAILHTAAGLQESVLQAHASTSSCCAPWQQPGSRLC